MTLNSYLPLITLHSPGQIAFYIGSWPVRWYGILIALAFMSAYIFCESVIKKSKLNLDYFNDLIFYVLISSIVFARLYFVLLSYDYFKYHLDEVPKIWLGGQSIHGALFGAIFSAYAYCKLKKVSFYKYMDILACFVPLGQAIGRWGNFFNNEAFGKPFISGIARVYIPKEYRPEQFISNLYFHPTFLYESFLNLMIFIFLFKNYEKWKDQEGKCFWVYLLSYSFVRFFLEFLRVDSLLISGLPAAQIISIIVIAVSCFMLCRKNKNTLSA